MSDDYKNYPGPSTASQGFVTGVQKPLRSPSQSVREHIANLHRRLIIEESKVNELQRRLEKIERFIGADFSQPVCDPDIPCLEFTD